MSHAHHDPKRPDPPRTDDEARFTDEGSAVGRPEPIESKGGETTHDVKPSEQRGGSTPDDAEARAKGPWAGSVEDGLVPAELGGSDAPEELLGDDPDLGSAVLGKTTGSDEPATEEGVDLEAGDSADATEDGGAEPPTTAEPDLKDVAAAQREQQKRSAHDG